MSHRIMTDVSTPAFIALYAWWMTLLVAYGLLVVNTAASSEDADGRLSRQGELV